jgi:hypothetical protein
MNFIDKVNAELKRAWANPAIKAILVAAMGGAIGAVSPMLMSGTFVLTTATTKWQ